MNREMQSLRSKSRAVPLVLNASVEEKWTEADRRQRGSRKGSSRGIKRGKGGISTAVESSGIRYSGEGKSFSFAGLGDKVDRRTPMLSICNAEDEEETVK